MPFFSRRWDGYSVKLQTSILLDPHFPFQYILQVSFCHFIFRLSVNYYIYAFSILFQKSNTDNVFPQQSRLGAGGVLMAYPHQPP